MAISRVFQREIVEVPFLLPDGQFRPHPALVLSTERLADNEDGMFYAALISTKNHLPDYTIEIQNEWLNKPLSKQSFFVTHIVCYFKTRHVINTYNTFVKQKYFDVILAKVINSMFDVSIDL